MTPGRNMASYKPMYFIKTSFLDDRANIDAA